MAYFAYSNPRSFAPDYIRQNSKDITVRGILQNINVATGYADNLYLPGQSRGIPAFNIGVLFQGYFKAPADGDFTFTSAAYTDDFGWIWTGDKAFANWTGSNRDAFSSFPFQRGSITVSLTEDQLLPVTILWGNHIGSGHLDISIYCDTLDEIYTDTSGLFYLPLDFDELTYPLPTQSSTATVTSPTSMVPSAAPTKTITTTVYANNVPESTATVTGYDAQETITVTYPYGMAYNAYISPYTPDKDRTWAWDFNNFGAMYFNFNNDENTLLTCGIATEDYINFAGTGYSALPGQNAPTDVSAIAIVYHGYFLAPVTGTYLFLAQFDDFGGIWIGDDAYTDWTWDNVIARGGLSSQDPLEHEFSLNEGDLVPCTILAANAYDSFSIGFALSVPGQGFINDFTGYFVQPHLADTWSPALKDPASCPLPPQKPGVIPQCDGKVQTAYSNYYSGIGYTESYDNPGNQFEPPIVNQYPASYDVCTVAELCGNKTITDIDGGYYSFDLHFLISTSMWECVEFWKPNSSDPSYFNVANSDVREAYGWSIYRDNF